MGDHRVQTTANTNNRVQLVVIVMEMKVGVACCAGGEGGGGGRGRGEGGGRKFVHGFFRIATTANIVAVGKREEGKG